jgi:hypothetical protein
MIKNLKKLIDYNYTIEKRHYDESDETGKQKHIFNDITALNTFTQVDISIVETDVTELVESIETKEAVTLTDEQVELLTLALANVYTNLKIGE